MKYALGNMLNGAGGLNADQLALDLPFAVTKSLIAAKGPTPTFTRASSGTFVGSNGLIQSAGNNVARFDHDPVTLASKGLLIEESRTNTFQRSEDFTQAIWTKTNVTVTGDNATSPDGNNTADSILETAINSGHRVQYGTSIGAGTYSASVYVKSVGGRNVNLEFVSGGSGAYANFNLQTAAVALSGAYGTGFTFISASITNAGNNWFRISLVATTPVSTSQLLIQILDGNNNSYLGDVTKGVQLWGAQLEAGSFATSYIPTTTASVVRSADVCSISGAAFSGFYNQPEGTLFADVTPQAVDQSSAVIVVNTTFFNNQNGIYKTNAALSGAGRRWGATTVFTAAQSSIATSTDVAISRSRLAYGYKLNDFAFAYAGGIVGTDTSGTIPSPTAMRIGARDDGLAINGHLAAVRYFRKRLDNSKLASITV